MSGFSCGTFREDAYPRVISRKEHGEQTSVRTELFCKVQEMTLRFYQADLSTCPCVRWLCQRCSKAKTCLQSVHRPPPSRPSASPHIPSLQTVCWVTTCHSLTVKRREGWIWSLRRLRPCSATTSPQSKALREPLASLESTFLFNKIRVWVAMNI